VPAGVTWSAAARSSVFVGKKESWQAYPGDDSLSPAQIGILGKVIVATNNVIIGMGGLDFRLPGNGALFALQNMTWNGVQGFSAFPHKTLYVPQHPISNNNSLSGYSNMGSWT
jgi:carboxypeptidase D